MGIAGLVELRGACCGKTHTVQIVNGRIKLVNHPDTPIWAMSQEALMMEEKQLDVHHCWLYVLTLTNGTFMRTFEGKVGAFAQEAVEIIRFFNALREKRTVRLRRDLDAAKAAHQEAHTRHNRLMNRLLGPGRLKWSAKI